MEAQQLFFMGRELQDDYDTEYYSILHGSHILLVIHNASPAIVKAHNSGVHVVVSVPSLGRRINLILQPSNNVSELKELLQEHTDGAILADQVTLFFNKVKMEEGKSLSIYNSSVDMMEVDVVVSQPPHVNIKEAKEPQCMKMKVKVKRGAQMVILEMRNLDLIRELRTKLSKVEPHFLQPVDGGGSFMYKQNVMDEDHTLHWYKFKSGDTIEILKGDISARD
ncbi:hypothetical protein HU200_053642 [Digitaria exilis]|uniref:Ubiquitin-like domain-containing protein n=1 Tax=Digitaria exilis TaxID=1010633 RepID=A0A835E3B6_9POAL|nr:hypothetical protein HU200_053642 [Digitaria exilis]